MVWSSSVSEARHVRDEQSLTWAGPETCICDCWLWRASRRAAPPLPCARQDLEPPLNAPKVLARL